MKIEKTEHGIKLIPETPWEEECLKSISSKGPLSAIHEDTWNQEGPLKLEFKPHPWTRNE